ncbi:MAG: Sir2 family NAD-dependent protein deacetylase, partial [Trueperaceae bacterium]
GDVHLLEGEVERLVVRACLRCGGTLKPDVVFFGEHVPRARVASAFALLRDAEALLVLGSSLTVFSGYRFVRAAREANLPIAIVNDGPTRGDGEADLRLHARLAPVLSEAAQGLTPQPPLGPGRPATSRTAAPPQVEGPAPARGVSRADATWAEEA